VTPARHAEPLSCRAKSPHRSPVKAFRLENRTVDAGSVACREYDPHGAAVGVRTRRDVDAQCDLE
jgi:hypothetical protein